MDRCFSCCFHQNIFKLLDSQYLLVNKISRLAHAVLASSAPCILYKHGLSRCLWHGAGRHSILLTLLSSFEEWTSVWSMIRIGNRQHENNVSDVLNGVPTPIVFHRPLRHEHMPLSFPLSSVTHTASGCLGSLLPTPLAQHWVSGGEGCSAHCRDCTDSQSTYFWAYRNILSCYYPTVACVPQQNKSHMITLSKCTMWMHKVGVGHIKTKSN